MDLLKKIRIVILLFFIMTMCFIIQSFAAEEADYIEIQTLSEEYVGYDNLYKVREELSQKKEYKKNTYFDDSNEISVYDYILQEGKKRNTSINILNYHIPAEEAEAFAASVLDIDEVFYANKVSWVITTIVDSATNEVIDSYVGSIVFEYFLTLEQITNAYSVLDSEVNRYKVGIKNEWNNLEKILYTNDFLCRTCRYYPDKNSIPNSSHSLYGVFVEKTPVCDGYSYAFRYLLKQIGIEAKIVTSLKLNHAWNLVKLNDQYYHVDVTWNDSEPNKLEGCGRASYKYFLLSDTAIRGKGHSASDWVIDASAPSTTYDSAVLNSICNFLVYENDRWYYVDERLNSSTVTLNKLNLRDYNVTKDGEGKELTLGDNTIKGPGITSNGEKLYLSTGRKIFECDYDGNNIVEFFSLPDTSHCIYAIEFKNNIFYYDTLEYIGESYSSTTRKNNVYRDYNIPLTGISLNKNILELSEKNATENLIVTFEPENTTDSKELIWTSDNTSVATVDDTGKVTAIGNGATTVTVSSKSRTDKKATCVVNVSIEETTPVNIPITKISLDKYEISFNESKLTEKLSATIIPSNTTDDKTLIWSSGNTKVATVDNQGNVTSVGNGSTAVTVSSKVRPNIKQSCVINVAIPDPQPEPKPIRSLSLNKTSIKFEAKNATENLEITVTPNDTTDSRELIYTSSNTNVATVDNNGKITAINNGTATIEVKSKARPEISVSCTVTVEIPQKPITSISLNKVNLTLDAKGATEALIATITPEDTTESKELIWTSSNSDVVTVDNEGRIKAVRSGTSIITVKSKIRPDIYAICTVSVVLPIPEDKPINGIYINKSSVEFTKKGESVNLIAIVSPIDTTDSRDLIWSSSNSKVATVNSIGRVTAVGRGTAIIEVKSKAKPEMKVTCEIKVNIPEVKLPFNDVRDNSWFIKPLKFMYENKYITGTSFTEFSPNMNLSRGMLVTILYNMEGNPKVIWTNKFPDVKDGKWYTSAVMWASQNRVVSGYDDGTFLPDANISRQEVAVMLANYYRFKTGKDIEVSGSLTGYQDINGVSQWAKQSVQWAVNNQIMSGKNNNSKKYIAPQGKATRAEAVTMIFNYINKF